MTFGVPVITGALVALAGALTCAPAAAAATLVGGHEQAAIAKAFVARGAHAGQVIVSTRTSAATPAWAIVKSVTPRRAGTTNPTVPSPTLRSTYLHSAHDRWKTVARIPAAVRAYLAGDFRVAVVYSGSGSESIAYHQAYTSVCAGSGGFTDEQTDTVDPMSWSVRYVVDLDALQSAVRGPAGTVLVPNVSFERLQSAVRARQTLSRTIVDVGCNGTPTTFTCQAAYALGSSASGLLSFPAVGGLEIGVPAASTGTGDCDPSDYTLGPSLWDSGATTVIAALGLAGGTLPADPYAPVTVAWPGSSAGQTQGFLQSPCAGDAPSCTDTFAFKGRVTLAPISTPGASRRAGLGVRSDRRGRFLGRGNRGRLRGVSRRAGIGIDRSDRSLRDRRRDRLGRLRNLEHHRVGLNCCHRHTPSLPRGT